MLPDAIDTISNVNLYLLFTVKIFSWYIVLR